MAGPTITPAMLLKCRMLTISGPQIGLNISYFQTGVVTGVAPDLGQLTTAFEAFMAPKMKAVIANTASWRGLGLTVITPTPSLEQTSVATAGPGGGGITQQPREVSGIITLRSPFPGRVNRGRMYVPFPATAWIDTDTTPTAAYVTALNAIGGVFVGPTVITIGGGVSVQLSGVIRHKNPALFPTAITSFTSQKKWAVQHRRGDYGKPNIPPF